MRFRGASTTEAAYLEVATLDDAATHAVYNGGEVDGIPLGAVHGAPQAVDHLTGEGHRSDGIQRSQSVRGQVGVRQRSLKGQAAKKPGKVIPLYREMGGLADTSVRHKQSMK